MKTITDCFEPYIGTKEYNGIVKTMIEWYYGHFAKVAWCAISCSYMANQLGISDQFGGKNDNVYHLMKQTEAANKKTGKGLFKYTSKIQKGTVIKRGTVLFLLKSAPPMTAVSSKHVTTAYKDFTYTGSGWIQTLGGNQSDYIRIANYPQKYIYAIFEPEYEVKHPTLRKGDSGEAVKELQADLNYFGYRADGEKLNTDGKFGTKTEAALKEMQKDQDLEVDGVCGTESWRRLDEMKKETVKVRLKSNSYLRPRPATGAQRLRILKKGTTYTATRITKWVYLVEAEGWVPRFKVEYI